MSKTHESTDERIERERREEQQLLKLQRFHDRVAQGAGIAFQVMLERYSEGKEGVDLVHAEPAAVEKIARMAWAWGVTFAESAGDEG